MRANYGLFDLACAQHNSMVPSRRTFTHYLFECPEYAFTLLFVPSWCPVSVRASPLPNPRTPAVGADPHRGGGDKDRHLPPDSPEADTAGVGEVPAAKPEDALPYQGHQPGKLSTLLIHAAVAVQL